MEQVVLIVGRMVYRVKRARMQGEAKRSIKSERKRALRAAKDLCYSVAVIEAIRNARTIEEITKIMHRARCDC